MKSRKEIEELLGKELQYVQHEVRSNSDWGNFGIDVLDTYWELTEDDIKKVKDLLESSIESNDIDTALGCCNLLGEKKVDKEVLQQLIDVTVQQLSEDVNSLNPETSIDKFKRITDKIHNVTRSNFSQNKSIIQLSELLENKINSIMTSLDGRITELKQHIEIPENEEQIKALQEKIEGFESSQYGVWYEREEDTYRSKRIREEGGIEVSDLLDEISEYKYNTQTQKIDQRVSSKVQYLEQKLAILTEHKDIQGNDLRIAEIQSQIETIEDSWVVAQAGYNNIDGILQTAESRKNEIQDRLAQAKQDIETIDSMSMAYIQKRTEIESLTKEVAKYERYIERMQQTKIEIENGENPSFMGKHHRDRLQREEQERVETNRGKIQDLEGQIAELQKHIEIPENEQRIIDLQAQIDEIEATIPSDRGNHKRERLQEQGRDTEAIMTDIDDIIVRFNDPYVQGKAERIDTEIKTRVVYLENKMNYLQQHLDIAGNEERVAKLQSQIEQIEDKWELCTQGFGSKEQIEQRIRVTKAHLHTTLMSFKGNKELKLSPEQMQEYWNKIQNGEEVPELFGQHHRERLEREKEARIRAEQQEKDMLEQEYGLVGIEDRETLQRRLEDIVSKGIFLGADKASEKKVAEFKRMKQVIPRFEEFKSVYLQLRQAGLEDDLYANMDFQNVSFDDLLERATTILEEKAKAEEQRTEIEQPEVIIEEQPEVVTNPEQVVEETIEDTTATVTGTNIDIDSASMMEAHLEYMRNHQTQQTSQVVEDYWNEIHSQQAKVYKQPQPEKIRPREKSIKDEVEDDLRTTEQHTQKQDNPSVDLWMNRFNGWYSVIDRVSQSVKEKFVKMKSDIIKAISEKLKERTNNRQVNTQEQDTNER
ncbi:MAG: hypothetical protein ACLVA2_04960 [Clostridia bacterium]